MKRGDNTTPAPADDLPVSARIRQRLQQSGRPFHANDHIADALEPGEIEALVDEVAARMQDVLEALVIDTVSDHNTQDTARRVARM
jgi:GTP cyclohydrolase I